MSSENSFLEAQVKRKFLGVSSPDILIRVHGKNNFVTALHTLLNECLQVLIERFPWLQIALLAPEVSFVLHVGGAWPGAVTWSIRCNDSSRMMLPTF